VAAVVLALCLATAPAAGAFSEAGNPCLGDDTEAGTTMIGLTNQGSEPFMQPNVPPEAEAVITRWRVLVGPGLRPLEQQLVISHQVGEEDDVRVAESAIETVVPGSNEFATRIPVSDYDHIGLRGPAETLICNQQMNVAGRVEGEWETGETRHYEVLVHVGVPVVVRLEPDRDRDGYGDESQDGCPASAAFQTTCPLLELKASRAVKRRAILVQVTPSTDSAILVWGEVGWWGKRPGGDKRRRHVNLVAGPRRSVAAGSTATFRLPLAKSILRQLDRLTPRQGLRVKLTLGVRDVYGAGFEKLLVVRLRGRG
jgi:hypothetical protein